MKEEDLVGWYFVTVNDDKRVSWQGAIESMVSDAGYYRVVFFSWMSGDPNGRQIWTIDELRSRAVLTGRTAQAHDDMVASFGDRPVSIATRPWPA